MNWWTSSQSDSSAPSRAGSRTGDEKKVLADREEFDTCTASSTKAESTPSLLVVPRLRQRS